MRCVRTHVQISYFSMFIYIEHCMKIHHRMPFNIYFLLDNGILIEYVLLLDT